MYVLIYLVLSAMIQKSEIRMYVPRSFSHLSGESSKGTDLTSKRNDLRLSEQDVGETTRRQNDRKS